jgi:hypothetical protein
MKVLTVLALMFASVFTANFALGAAGADRPSDVAAKDWIPISEKLGFVVVTPKSTSIPLAVEDGQILLAPPGVLSAELMPPAKGYFVVKTATGWQRLVIADAG